MSRKKRKPLPFAEEHRYRVITESGVRETTRRKKLGTSTHFKEFEKRYNLKLKPDFFDPEGFQLFLGYLFSRGLNDGTVSRHVKELRWFLNVIRAPINLEHIKYKAGPTYVLFLTKEELNYLWKLDLKGGEKTWRDYILFMSYTGMRFGDAVAASYDWVDHSGKTITYIQEKTGIHVTMPLVEKAKRILIENGGMLPSISNQKLNVGLKTLFRRYGMDRNVTKYHSVRGRVVMKTYPLWKVVSSHVGRKTFTMNAVLSGIHTQAVKTMSGHRSEEVLKSYIRLSNQHLEQYREMMEKW